MERLARQFTDEELTAHAGAVGRESRFQPGGRPHLRRHVRAVPQGRWGKVKLNLDAWIDPRNFPYAWLSFTHEPAEPPDLDTDVGAAYNGWITVSPLDSDITWREGMGALAKGLADL